MKTKEKTMTKQEKLMRGKGFVPASEVAAAAGVGDTAVYKAIDDGRLVGQRVGGRRYVSLHSAAGYYGETIAKAAGWQIAQKVAP